MRITEFNISESRNSRTVRHYADSQGVFVYSGSHRFTDSAMLMTRRPMRRA